MKSTHVSFGPRFLVFGAAGVFGAFGASLLLATSFVACGTDRTVFEEPPTLVAVDDAAVAPVDCPLQCSLDGRSVLRSCSGEVVETCADDRACGEAKCQDPCDAAAADRSSNGCSFFFANARFTQIDAQSCHAAFVVNASNQPATLAMEFEGKALDLTHALFRAVPNSTKLEPQTGPIAPGESAILFVSDRDQTKARTLAEKYHYIGCPYGVTAALEKDFGAFNSSLGQAFHLTSNVPVGVTSMYPYGGAASFIPSATLVFPVSAWAKEHVVVNGWEGNYRQPSMQVYASEDDTEVTLIGNKDIVNGIGFTGAAAGTPMKIKLAKGQFAQIVQTEELTGSFVVSDKPTVTVGGNDCAFVPSGSAAACDTLAQQIPPFEQWGSEYVGVGYRPRIDGADEDIWYRMVGARDGTELDYDPFKPSGAPLVLAAGEKVLFRARANEPFVVRSRDAQHPFYLGMHMTGGASVAPDEPSYGGQGDPEFVNIVPAAQYMNAYSFYADSTYPENSLVIVRKKTNDEFKDVWLECAGNLPTFLPVDSRGVYEYTRVNLSRRFGPGDTFGDKTCITGLQRMHSDGAFTATIWGWGIHASYAYPGGMAIRRLVELPLVVN